MQCFELRKIWVAPQIVEAVNLEVKSTSGRVASFIPTPTCRIEDTGGLTIKRMETVDEEFLEAALDFIDREHRPASRSSAIPTRRECTFGPT